MYDRYWGLQRPVFAPGTSSEGLDASPSHREALARIDFLRESQLPMGLVVGPAGSGKTSVLAEFARRAERTGNVTATVSASAAAAPTLVATVSRAPFPFPAPRMRRCR